MKLSIVLALIMAATSFAFAEGGAAETKVDKKQAKMECLKENPQLKGKELKHCVKEKVK